MNATLELATDSELLQAVGIKVDDLVTVQQLEALVLSKSQTVKANALLELTRRFQTPSLKEAILSPRAAGAYLLPRYSHYSEERFGLLALDAKGNLIGEKIIAHGTTTGTQVSPREFFREALRFGATSALAFHNHPSGDPTPSREDVQLTKRLRAAGESLGVLLADHIIVGNERYHSFRAAEGWDTNG